MSGRLFPIANVVDSDDWYTPAWVFEGMGITFDVDVAAPDGGVAWIPATRSLTVADDGLSTDWSGTVWCNPPYSEPLPWCQKWAQHDGAGAVLLRADLSSRAPFTALGAASSLYVPERRMQFVNGAGAPTGSVNFSTVIIGKGPAIDAALDRLASLRGGRSFHILEGGAQ